MMKWVKAMLAPVVIASLVLVQPTVANAGRWHHHHGGGGFGPGLFVGAVFGMIAGAAHQFQNNNYYNSGYYSPGYYDSCKRVVRVCRNRYGPYGTYVSCFRRVRYVC